MWCLTLYVIQTGPQKCPEIWLNIVVGVSARAFVDEINIGMGRQE